MTDISQSVAETFARGFESHQQGDLEAAKRLYLEVLTSDPDHADALHLLGNLDLRGGRLEDAERLVRKAISVNPKDAGYFNTLGQLLQSRDNPVEAESAFKQALELDPRFVAALSNLGALHQARGRLQQALEYFDKAIEQDPQFLQAHIDRGRVLNNLRRYEDAAAAFRQAVKIRPDFAEAHNNLGHVYRAMGEMERAAGCFVDAIRIDPENALAYHNLGTAFMELNKPEEALKAFEKSVELNPKDMLALTNLGVILHNLGKLKGAVESYEKALILNPNDPAIFHNLGVVYSEQRKTEEAEAQFRKALAIDPTYVDALAQLAALYEETNQLEDAESVVAQGVGIEPGHPLLNLQAAKVARRRKDIDGALKALDRLDEKKLIPRLAQQYHYELGNLLDRNGDTERAYENFVRGNDLARNSLRVRNVDPQRFLDHTDVLHALFSRTEISNWTPTPEYKHRNPVFLIGFPRSGTTLTEVMLDSHPGIQTVEEKPTVDLVESAVAEMPSGYPGALPALSADDVERLRDVYHNAVRRLADPDTDKLLVDKSAGRTVQTGLIWRLFPEAKYIFLLRHPCDACLSGFMQQFSLNNDAFANFFSLDDATRLYDKVVSLWRLFVEVLPIQYHLVRYENLVENVEEEVRGLLEFLEMPWDAKVLDHRRRALERGSITPSYHQVTEPVYKHARNRWHRYRSYLEPYLDRLAPHVEHFGYSLD